MRYVLEEVWAEGDTESELHVGSLHFINSGMSFNYCIAGVVTLPQEALFYDLFHSFDPPPSLSAKAKRRSLASVKGSSEHKSTRSTVNKKVMKTAKKKVEK